MHRACEMKWKLLPLHRSRFDSDFSFLTTSVCVSVCMHARVRTPKKICCAVRLLTFLVYL